MAKKKRSIVKKEVNPKLSKTKHHTAIVEEIAAEVTGEKQRPMGLGDLGDTNVVFKTKHRWTLESEHLAAHFIRSVEIDYVKKKIFLSAYEIADTRGNGYDIVTWGEHLGRELLPDEELYFNNWDGCGNCLYGTIFSDLKLLEQKSKFDYSESGPAIQELVVGYEECELIPNHLGSTAPKFVWEMQVKSEGFESKWHKVRLSSRPTMNVEECQITHLNASMWLPGRATWEPIDFSMTISDQNDGEKWINHLADQKEVDVHLRLVKNKTTVEQTWILQKCKATKFHPGERVLHFSIRFQGVQFECKN